VGINGTVWERAAGDVLRWRVKTASGFSVGHAGPLVCGDRVIVTARLLG
jgi:hypothetical protein